ncbi:MAG: activase [Spirochaetaceae bacterium]|nr:activase [Spirochaetaceae bacterium]
MKTLGINVGSSSLKLVLADGGTIVWSVVLPHEGDFPSALARAFEGREAPTGIPALVTGNEGRGLFALNNTIEPLCVEAALRETGEKVDAVVAMGGEDLIVYAVDGNHAIQGSFSGNKCASGTGEFFKQQLARMDMTLGDVASISTEARALPLSTRCSVFMKSDCTHRLNKREATKDDIVLSLSMVMATKVVDFLKRARIEEGRVMLTGGTTRNPHILRFIRGLAPRVEFVVPPEAAFFEAYGAAVLAREKGSPLPAPDRLLAGHAVRFDRLESFEGARDMVRVFEGKTGAAVPGRAYVLGVDGGSTTTKACLVDLETDEVVASHYGRTHGDPVRALKTCLGEIRKKAMADTGGEAISIPLCATTGSSREILGVFLETRGVYNEIIAHSVGTAHFSKDVDTIFEIGGQDAKYVLLKNGVPIDYAMNEACSAGTGSFLEESAAGDLSIRSADEIGPVALAAKAPLKFGEHCSAFINSDIRKAVQQGAAREDITAGIVASIVANYLNRVVGNRTIGKVVFLQGGVAKNPAVPLAFASLLGKPILVPPSPELMGAFGVALLAKAKAAAGLLEGGGYSFDEMLGREIVYERVFPCASCDNRCPIQALSVSGRKYLFGGRCNKYANLRKKAEGGDVTDWVAERNELLFVRHAPNPETFVRKREAVVGIPRCFSVHSLYPFYSRLFHELGVRTFLSEEVDREGVARAESTYCFPAEIAHGAVEDVWKRGADFIFLPHFRDMPSYEEKVHANFCPITQALPYYIEKAFPEIPKERFLPVVVSFKFGRKKALEHFAAMGAALGVGDAEMEAAFDRACAAQDAYFAAAAGLGRRALEESRKAGRPAIALLGRPYNTFTPEANMGIPRKFTTRGHSVLPFDILPFEGRTIFSNMYWYYGQQDLKAAALVKEESDLYVAFVSNFSCAPDSFILHYVKWIMGAKPFLVLELDSHSADAGIDTRVEAFLDIIDGYRSKLGELEEERYDNGLRFVNDGKSPLHVLDTATGGRRRLFGDKKVKLLLSNMGELSTELMAAVLRGAGVNAEALPVATSKTIRLARAHASGKECVPSHLVLGSALEYFFSDKYRKDELYLLFVPITTGPCRTGQYFVYFENLFRDLRLENVVVVTLSADNSYNEFGPRFSRDVWRSIAVADYMKDLQNAWRALAVEPEAAMAWFSGSWRELLSVAEKDLRAAGPVLRRVAREAAAIPLRRRVGEAPRVLVVGEIYVRRDDFAVDELVGLFSSKGIIAKVSGIGEWIHYLDFVRRYDLRKRLRLLPPWRRPFSAEARKLLRLRLEEAWKHGVENGVKRALAPSGLLPETPHDMRRIMANAEEHFLDHELNSEIVVSSGVAATAMQEGYSGIVNISPFACLIGRVIEGLVTPWARARNYPMISVEVDGNLLPPGTVNKIDIFMVNVLRFGGRDGVGVLVEGAAEGGAAGGTGGDAEAV